MPTTVRHLYAHIPFCPSKCSYCAFVTHVGTLKLVPPYLDALCRDAERAAQDLPGGPLETIYLGGGTPSLLTPPQVSDVLGTFVTLFGLLPTAEVTLEAHPSTVDEIKLHGFRLSGVTRISFGGETLSAPELRSIGRGHTPDDVLQALAMARRAGFESVAVDLMYGLPGQSLSSWSETLKCALGAGVDHFSLYPLAVEPRTVFARRRREGRLVLPDDDDVVEMYSLACRLLRDQGLRHYEVSSWARPGHECRHNIATWLNRQFYAVGVGAHGYLKPYRTERVTQTKRYIDLVSAGEDPVARREVVDAQTEHTETMMLGLRLLDVGINMAQTSRLGDDLRSTHGSQIDRLAALGLVRVDGDRLLLEEAAVPLANEVWREFM